jgi:3-hydroxyacyl-[acyl-carrier-protein] dehydratase
MKGILLNDFFEIISQENTENTLNTLVKLRANHRIFEGHFPNSPIVPGVCIMQIAKEILMQKTQCNLQMVESSNIKFINPIDPRENETVMISITYSSKLEQIPVVVNVGLNGHIFCKFQALYQVVL